MAENDNRQMRNYGDDERVGKAKYRSIKAEGAVPPFYKIPAGKDVMLKDILYRLDNREFGKDIFEDKDWLERRLYELSCHKDKSSYEGTEYSAEKGRRARIRITKEQLVERVSGMLESVNQEIYNHTIPVIVVNEALAYVQDKTAPQGEIAECNKNLEGVIKYMLEEDSPEEYYSSPVYNRATGEFQRKRIKKDEVLGVAMDLKIQLQETLGAKKQGETQEGAEPNA